MVKSRPTRASRLSWSAPRSHRLGWKLTDVMVGDFDGLLASLDAAGEAYADGVMRMVYRQIGTITEITGNSKQVPWPPTWDDILDMWEEMEFSFDRDGNPNLPDMVTRPGGEPPAMEPRHHDRLGQIIGRKKEEHRAARGSRRLS